MQSWALNFMRIKPAYERLRRTFPFSKRMQARGGGVPPSTLLPFPPRLSSYGLSNEVCASMTSREGRGATGQALKKTKVEAEDERANEAADDSAKEESDFSERLSDVDEDAASEETSSIEDEEDQPSANNGKSRSQEEQKRKKSQTDGKPEKKRKIIKSRGETEDSDSAPEIVKGLSGDEVDTANIVKGGRGARRGRATQAAQQMEKYKQKAQDSDEDSW